MGYLLVHGDARRLPIDPKSIDAIVTDPPYGINWDTNYLRFEDGRRTGRRRTGRRIDGDHKPFDATPWLEFAAVCLFGAHCFCSSLPIGSWLVWDKRFPSGEAMLADAELAWINRGHGVYIFAETCQGFVRPEPVEHPTQKPVSVMRWCIQKLKLKPNSLIVDPYMGSGSTAIAAQQEGHRFIGLDLHHPYVEIAKRRLERPHAPIPRPGREEKHPLFDDAP